MTRIVTARRLRWTHFAALLCVACAVPLPGHANNAACMGMDNPSRPDISCTRLTERLLLSLRGASRAEVEKTMNAPGVMRVEGTLHYIGWATTYSGFLNVTFKNGRAIVVEGLVQPTNTSKDLNFLWNGEHAVLCSDFPGSRNQCNH
jgi:hypothetical protein